jgi:DNA repair protein RecO (recombination protein O)
LADSREYQTEAVVIKKIKLGEADRILTLYTSEYGKIDAVAKGVRRPKSKMAGHLELLTYSQIRLARGRNLDTIIGSQTIESFLTLKNDLWLTSYGLYAAELLYQFSASHVPNLAMFKLFLDTLKYLSEAGNSELILRYYELYIVDNSGYKPQLRECVGCRNEIKPEINAFCSRSGGVLCPGCRFEYPDSFPISVDALKVLRLFQKSNFDIVNRLKCNLELSRELKGVLGNYIRYLLEKEVKSAAWLDDLRDNSTQS